MSYQELDRLFPFVVFAYGAIMTLTLNSSWLMKIAEQRFPAQLHKQMNAHRGLGVICLCVGSLWCLQNIWLGA